MFRAADRTADRISENNAGNNIKCPEFKLYKAMDRRNSQKFYKPVR